MSVLGPWRKASRVCAFLTLCLSYGVLFLFLIEKEFRSFLSWYLLYASDHSGGVAQPSAAPPVLASAEYAEALQYYSRITTLYAATPFRLAQSCEGTDSLAVQGVAYRRTPKNFPL